MRNTRTAAGFNKSVVAGGGGGGLNLPRHKQLYGHKKSHNHEVVSLSTLLWPILLDFCFYQPIFGRSYSYSVCITMTSCLSTSKLFKW